MLRSSALGSRVLNALSPEGKRGDEKFLHALTDTSKLVAALLGQVCDAPEHKDTGLQTQKLLTRLASTAAPLTQKGVDLLDALRLRVEVHARHMTAGQLLALRDGLAQVKQSPDIRLPEGAEQMDVMHRAVQQALATHTQSLLAHASKEMLPALQQLVEQLPREAGHPGAMAQQFAQLHDWARKLLQAHSFPLHDPQDCAAMQRELVQALCNEAVQNATISHGQLGDLLQTLAPRQQAELRLTTRRILDSPPTTFLEVLDKASLQWLKEAQQRLHHAAQALNAHPSLKGQALAEQTICFETALHAVKDHFTAHGQHVSPAPDDIEQKTIRRRLETTLLQPDHLSLKTLDNRLLNALSLSVTRLNMAGTSQRMAQAVRERQAAADLPYVNAMHTLTEALHNGKLSTATILQYLGQAAHRRELTKGIYQQLGTALVTTDQTRLFHEDRMRTAVQQWDRVTLLALREALDQPAACAMANALEQLGRETLKAIVHPQDANALLGKQLLDAHSDLLMLRQAVVTQLVQQGIAPPQVQRERFGPADLDAGALASIRARFGIALRPTGASLQATVQKGTAGHTVQAMFLDHLHTIASPAATALSASPLPQAIPHRVDPMFWIELASADCQIHQANGIVRPLVDHAALAQAQDPAQRLRILEQAVIDLDSLLGGNHDLLLRVTALATLRLGEGLQLGLQSEHSPVRLPDGRRGALTGGQERLGYLIACDAPGTATLQFRMTTSQATHFSPAATPSITQSVDPRTSHFSAWGNVRIGQDLGLSTPLPLQFSFHADPQVLTVNDLLACGDTVLQTQFAHFLENRRVSENWNFLVAHQQFLQQQTPAGAQSLVSHFIGDQAPEQVNISAQLARQILADSALARRSSALAKVAAELRTMLDQGGIVKDFFNQQVATRTPAI